MHLIPIDATAGGQVFRTAIGLSALLTKPVAVTNIRASRSKPGLRPQHVTVLQTIAQLCAAQVKGAHVHSKSVVFEPKSVLPNTRLTVNIGTAGSVSLLIQSIMLPALLGRFRLRMGGGTNVPFAPPFEFLQTEWLPVLRTMGVKAELSLSARGYYPSGNGLVSFASTPAAFPLKPVCLQERGELQSVQIVSHCASLPRDVAVRQAKAVRKVLSGLNVDITESIFAKETAFSYGSGISVFGRFASGALISASALGQKKKPAETVGREAAQKFKQCLETSHPVDSFLADQLVPFMALARGVSRLSVVCLDEHVFSNIRVCEQFLDCRFEVTSKVGEPGEIKVKGVSFVP